MIKFLSTSVRRSQNMIRKGSNKISESYATDVIVSGSNLQHDDGFARLWTSYLNSETTADDFLSQIMEVEKRLKSSNKWSCQVFSEAFSMENQSSMTEVAILRAIDSVWKHPNALGALRFLLLAFTRAEKRNATHPAKRSIDQVVVAL